MNRIIYNRLREVRTSMQSLNCSLIENYPKNCLVNNNIGIKLFVSTKWEGEATYDDIKKVTQNQDNILLIDVREPHELTETGTLPNSINIPLAELEQVLRIISKEDFLKKYGRPKPEKFSSIIYSCRSGKRSAQAQNISQQLGYMKTKNYLGGWLEWEEKNK